MRHVDHLARRLAGLARQFSEDLVEHAKAAPAHEPAMDRLVRTMAGWRIVDADGEWHRLGTQFVDMEHRHSKAQARYP